MHSSSQNLIQAALESMVAIVRENGGFVHAELTFDVTSQNISVFAPSHVHGELLVHIPQPLLIPLDEFKWENRDGFIQVVADSHLSAVQGQLLDNFIQIYNARTPLRWAKESLPLANLANHPELNELVRAVLPQLTNEVKTPVDVFLATRSLGLKTSHEQAIDGRNLSRQSVLMPVIDFFNHHPAGAGFKVHDHGISLLGSRGAENGEGELARVPMYASYGNFRDSFMMALHYGYLETNTPWLFSVPFSWEDVLLGTIEVQRTGIKRANKYRLPRITDQEILSMSHAIFDLRQPQAWKVGIQLALMRRARRLGLSDDVAKDAVQRFASALIDYNMACYAEIKAQIGTPSEPWQKLLVEVSSLILSQLKTIKNETL